MGWIYRLLKYLLLRVGLNIRSLRNHDGRLVGGELRFAGQEPPSGNGEIVTSTIDGKTINFFIRNAHDLIQSYHNRGKFYEEEELAIISEHFRGGVFLDVGANVGNHAVYVGKYLGATSIIAVEPNPSAYLILLVNLALNGLAPLTVHHAVGLSDSPGKATSQTPNDNLGGTQLIENDEGGIFLLAGDSLFSHEKIDFIKIDTEGHEIRTLKGLQATILRNTPPIFVEVDDRNLAPFEEFTDSIGYIISARYKRYEGLENFLITPRVVFS